jgi:hypothetical protein
MDHVELVACQSTDANPSKLARTIAFDQAVCHLQRMYIWSTFFGNRYAVPPLAFISVSARSWDHRLINRYILAPTSLHCVYTSACTPCYVMRFLYFVGLSIFFAEFNQQNQYHRCHPRVYSWEKNTTDAIANLITYERVDISRGSECGPNTSANIDMRIEKHICVD